MTNNDAMADMLTKMATDDVCDNHEIERTRQEMGRPRFTAYAMIDSYKEGFKAALEWRDDEAKKLIDTSLACTACGAHVSDGIFGRIE